MADAAWLGGSRLTADVIIEVRDGLITSVGHDGSGTGASRSGAQRLHGVVLPGLVNAHSHAFHRLLRGRTHTQGGDFWLWRDRMYEIAGSLTPERYEQVATAVFVEMAMAGVTTVGEFHYVHHQPDGVPYADPNEMGHVLVRAARTAGINISLLDAGYFTGGFDERPFDGVQTRFADDSPLAWLDRVEAMRAAYGRDPDVVVGLAPHSVRAVPRAGLEAVADRSEPGVPIHIHVSEQPSENRECLEATTLTPTGLLEDVGLLGRDTTLVHATHLTDGDLAAIGGSASTVCYCATTERDLADGLGPAADLSAAGATLCVGSDSQAVIDLFEEVRGIELHSRLVSGTRGIFAPAELLQAATVNGSRSLGFPHRGLTVGSPADFVVIDGDSIRLAGSKGDTAVDSIVFAATAEDVVEVYAGGRRIVSEGRHPSWENLRGALEGWPRAE